MEADDDLLQKHHNNRNARATPDRSCSNTCPGRLLCKLRTASLDDFTSCEAAMDATTTPPPVAGETTTVKEPEEATTAGDEVGLASGVMTSLPVVVAAAILAKLLT